MAVAPMLKTTVLGHRAAMSDVIEALQRAGALDVVASELDLESQEIGPEDIRRLHVEERLAQAVFVRDFLGRYHTTDAPFSTFVAEKVHLSPERFFALEFDQHQRRVYRECEGISDRIASGDRERERLIALIRDLEPWLAFRLQIGQWTGTEHTALFTGTVPASLAADIRSRLREAVSEVTVEELGPNGDRQAWVVIASRDQVSEVRAVLGATDFTEVAFPGLEDYPAEEAADAVERIARIDAEQVRLIERATELAAKHYHEAVALVQALESDRDAILVHRDIAGTERAFIITGWVRESASDDVARALEPFGDSVDLSYLPPADEDEPQIGRAHV